MPALPEPAVHGEQAVLLIWPCVSVLAEQGRHIVLPAVAPWLA